MLKQSINKFLSVFGVGIFRLKIPAENNIDRKNNRAKWSDFQIKSPIEHNTAERMNDFFSDPEMLDQYLGEERILLYKEIVKIASENNIDMNGKDALDVGCGTGHLLSFFSERYNFKSITGLDFSESAIEVAKKTFPRGNFFVHDLYKKLDRKFDLILCTEVIEHLLNPASALKNILELMKQDSVCIITVPNGRIDQYEGHINFWSPESWNEFIKSSCNGFSVKTGTLMENKNNYAVIIRKKFNEQ